MIRSIHWVRLVSALAFIGLAACSDDTAAGDPACQACTATQVCVQTFDGNCASFQTACVERLPACAGTDCSAGCDQQCAGGATATTCSAAACGAELAGALHCYGP